MTRLSLVLLFSVAVLPHASELHAEEKKKNFDKVRTVINTAIQDSAFPSATVLVMQKGTRLFHEGFGRMTYDLSSRRTDTTTVYDLASVTKVLATTLSIMKLYELGKLRLDDSVSKFIPEFANHGKERITLTNLLIHDGGLPAFRPYERTHTAPDEAMRSLYNETPKALPGDTTIYSDLDFILLGEIVRRITGKRLDQFFTDTFAEPLGLQTTGFYAGAPPPDSIRQFITPVETDSGWKATSLETRPLVHDPRAAFFGGVAGHAGLFSSASDAATLMQMLMNGGEFGGTRYLKRETIALFTKRHSMKSTRALGWDTRSQDTTASTGKYFSQGSYGHLGYTGTSIWVDQARQLCVIFFTNRVYPTSSNNKIRAVRKRLHDAVIQSLSK